LLSDAQVVPLFVTVPRTVGVVDASRDWFGRAGEYAPRPRGVSLLWSADTKRIGNRLMGINQQPTTNMTPHIRPIILRALKGAGATCNGDSSTCAICAKDTPDCTADGLFNLSTFAMAARSVLCVEPPGDTLGRSHVFVAMLTGCIPVLIEGGHPAYSDEPVWWPWRKPPVGPPQRATNDGPAPTADPHLSLDYSTFTEIANASDVSLRGTGWVRDLTSLAADESKLARMRAKLRRVAPMLVYAPRRPANEQLDAFALVRQTVTRAWKVESARWRLCRATQTQC
jgi:hypothetical protein